MFYLLLILPHILALGGLLAFAMHTQAGDASQVLGGEDGSDGDGGSRKPPAVPGPVKPRGGLPLPHSGSPRRRLRVGERLRELSPALLRRGHPQLPPASPAAPHLPRPRRRGPVRR